MHGYGEIPFVELVEEFIKNKFSRDEMINNKVAVPGSTLVYQNQLIFGGTPPMLSNLDDFDSPYALGLYDEILNKYVFRKTNSLSVFYSILWGLNQV